MKRILGLAAAAAALLAATMIVRTLSLTSRQIEVPPAETIAVDEGAAAARFAEILRLRTISHQQAEDFEGGPFRALHAHLARTYPLVHRTLAREIVADYSLLYRWQGSDRTLEPIMFMSHLDVVPVEPGTEDEWTHPPFAGVIADGYVWGRGALDNKASTTAPLEAIETLLADGFAPRRTIYLAFGHDEEIGGKRGAASIAALLEERGVRLAYTVDEGMAIIRGMAPGIEAPTAVIGVAEKGSVSLRLTARGRGGHSSAPPAETTLGILSRAVAALEANPMAAELDGAAGAMFDFLAPEMSFGLRLLFANRWVTEGLIVSRMEESAVSNAMLRTTTAPTIIHGGIKSNVLPSEAYAVVNFRILPGDTIESVLAHAREVIDDPAVTVEPGGDDVSANPSPVSSVDGAGFDAISRSVREVFPGVLIAPGLLVAGTDTRHYLGITANGYRFIPWRLELEDVGRIHGTNERMAVTNYADIIRYYGQLIRHGAG
jgi:carboxypeptidase PM20D1